MSLIGKTLALLFGLALIAALGAAAWLALELIVSLFASLDPQVARVTAIGSLVVLLASLVLAAGIRDAGRRSEAAAAQLVKALAEMRSHAGSGQRTA